MSCRAQVTRGTTPSLEFEVMDADLTGWSVYLTMRTAGMDEPLTKVTGQLVIEYDAQAGTTTVTAPLSQEDTLALSVGTCESQIRAIKDGDAIATDVVQFSVSRILLEGEIDA